ncbi:MAG: hypothetical protein JNG83_04710 [Opitutaceae bacterium]|nr:hypothetical protein [Opitutaceae bacterium]
MSAETRPWRGLKRAGWQEAGLLLGLAWLVPFLVHLAPWPGPRPLGVHLLPLFWTTFVALYFYGVWPGLVAGLVTPLVNLAATGQPAALPAALMSLEAAAFVGAAALLLAWRPGCRVAAPTAWVAAKAGVITLQWAVPAFAYDRDPWVHFLAGVQNGLAGLAILAAINVGLVRLYPKTDDWERE